MIACSALFFTSILESDSASRKIPFASIAFRWPNAPKAHDLTVELSSFTSLIISGTADISFLFANTSDVKLLIFLFVVLRLLIKKFEILFGDYQLFTPNI